ncbi:hypothetical protein [Psychrobacter sp. Pi2-1]|nr:hypothetical protein [Psychrobacter sp. Pi2-1]
MNVYSLKRSEATDINAGQTGKTTQEMQDIFYHNFYSAFVIGAAE